MTSILARLPRVEDQLLLHRQMVETYPSPLMLFDASTLTVVEHNRAASAFFNEILEPAQPLDSLVGREPDEFFPNFAQSFEPIMRRAIETKEPCSAQELKLILFNGVERFVAVTAQPMVMDAVVPYLMVWLDEVTQAVVARERQQYLQRMESVGTLAGGLAHDVNNILFAIGGHAYMLQARPELPQEARAELDEIEAAIARAKGLTTKLLTFARGGSRERSPVSVNPVVTETLRMLSGSLGDELLVETSLDHTLPNVLADSGGLQQILMNLCVNARDAMEGSGKIVVRTSRENGSVLLEVRDSGPGIPPAIRSRIFEPFFTTKEGGGTGLGLSVVYGLVKNYGGTVTAGNAAGGGACFSVRLPASAAAVAARPAAENV